VNEPDRTGRPQASVSRRRVLAGLTGAGVAAGAGSLLAACSSGGGTSSGTSSAVPAAAVKPKRGGDLIVGLPGGSGSDTLKADTGLADIDYLRILALYQPLVQLSPQSEIEYVLAESITPDNGSLSRWIIRLRSGITFHSGKPLTASDVVFTFNRIITGTLPGSSPLQPVDLKNTKALDDRTVLVAMKQPYSSFVEQLAAIFVYLPIVPEGFKDAKGVYDGTGPFVFKSFTPGQRSVFTRNPNYWKSGLPYADSLTVIDFPDTTSAVDALITGAIHAAGLLDGPAMAQLANTSGVTAVPSASGAITPFTMRVDKPPFNDVRVRQALRLLVDRPQLIDSALDGYGTVGNDVFSPFDPDFNHGQVRQQDIPQAKSLLKAAGHEGLTVPLVTSAVSTGTVAMATVLAEQATAAGVTLKLQNVPPGTFFGPNYLQWPLSQDFYPYSPYLPQVAYSMLPFSPFNETHTNNPTINNLYNQANAAAAGSSLYKELLYEMQQFDFTQGGYIIPAYIDALDAYSAKISGYTKTNKAEGNPLSNFDVEHFYFVS
jgi:peptide/nickel transport system substrate-binding protein